MPRVIDRGGVAEMMEEGVPVIDVLPPKEHSQLRIAGSEGIWLRELDASTVEKSSRSSPVIVYCHDDL